MMYSVIDRKPKLGWHVMVVTSDNEITNAYYDPSYAGAFKKRKKGCWVAVEGVVQWFYIDAKYWRILNEAM